MAMVKQLDKRSGITYIYESASYWDREKKQPRSKRTLIGRLDLTTGEIVPTDGRGKRRAQKEPEFPDHITMLPPVAPLPAMVRLPSPGKSVPASSRSHPESGLFPAP